MALEDALAELTAAVKEQTAFLKTLQGKGGAAASTTTTGSGTKSSGTKGDSKAPEITEAEVQERVGKYLKTGTAEAREAAKGHVRQIIEHYGAPKFTAIKPAQWAAALADLDAFAEGGAPEWATSGDEGDDGDMV